MNETPPNAWFHTKDGQRVGPVSFEELETKARSGELNPRHDMVWCHGMSEWKVAGDVNGLFEKRASEEPAGPVVPDAEPYQPPSVEEINETIAREGGWPGARRRSFIAANFLFPILWVMVTPMGGALLADSVGRQTAGLIMMGASFVPFLVSVGFGVMRLMNLGMSGWWFFGNFVPILNFWVGYRCFACPAGYARHKKLDGAGIFLAIVYWLMVLLSVLVAAALVFVVIRAANDPELQNRLQEFIRNLETQSRGK